ncbi:MAG: hypothetical protein ACLFQ5_08055 [Oceanicaulis sp.]
MKNVFLAAFGAVALTGAASAQCYEIGPEGAGYTELTNYELRAETARPGLMDPPPLSDGARGMMCVRDTIVPDANDFELVRYHRVPLLLQEGVDEDARQLQLGFTPAGTDEAGEQTEPQYRVPFVRGDLTDDDRTAIVTVMQGFAERENALAEYMQAEAEAED